MESAKDNRKALGAAGEKIAMQYLSENNYKIIGHNFRVGRLGEIDIIAFDREFICFIEVKTRRSTLFGMPSEAVNRRKQQSIIRLAQIFLNSRSLQSMNVRFDVIEVIMNKDSIPNINLIKNAFN